MIAVGGSCIAAFNRRRDGSGFADWAHQAALGALADAGLAPTDIDSLILASESDFFTLQLNPAAVLAADLGLRHAAVLRVEGGGASGHLAVHAGVAQVLAGLARRVLVLGVEATASALPAAQVRALYAWSFDAWTDGMTGAGAAALYALSALAFIARTGAGAEDFAAVAVAARRHALDNPAAHLGRDSTLAEVLGSAPVSSPYRRLDCSPLSDGAAALVLARPADLPQARSGAARIAGIGAANDHPRLGERADPGRFAAKTAAARRACRMAGVADPAAEIGLAEVYDAFSGAQLQAIEALGLARDLLAEHRAGGFAAGGRLPVNLSGGLLGQGAAPGATGIAQVATCARQIEGRYHPRLQLPRPPRLALADTHGGIATTCAVSILRAGAAA
jgi:acetyl-CoA C-acetyltransferase